MSGTRVFVSFDIEHDRDLFERLQAQSLNPRSGFEISGRSELAARQDPLGEEMRRQIREADEVIVICGEHTDASIGVQAELCIAREERTPHFLLWGRREIMCTKPAGAKPGEGMYSWTAVVLHEQLVMTLRNARAEIDAEAAAEALGRSRARPGGRSG